MVPLKNCIISDFQNTYGCAKITPDNKQKYITIESLNKETLYMLKVFDKIKQLQNSTDISKGVVLDGVTLSFKALNLNTYTTPENYKYLDQSTLNTVIASRSISKENAKEAKV